MPGPLKEPLLNKYFPEIEGTFTRPEINQTKREYESTLLDFSRATSSSSDVLSSTPDLPEDWQSKGKCLGILDYMIIGRNDDPAPRKAICAMCVVIEPCREDAIVNNRLGVQGGLTGKEIREERKRRRLVG